MTNNTSIRSVLRVIKPNVESYTYKIDLLGSQQSHGTCAWPGPHLKVPSRPRARQRRDSIYDLHLSPRQPDLTLQVSPTTSVLLPHVDSLVNRTV